MYIILADGVQLFSGDDVQVVRRIFRIYRELYVWASVRVMKKVRAR